MSFQGKTGLMGGIDALDALCVFSNSTPSLPSFKQISSSLHIPVPLRRL